MQVCISTENEMHQEIQSEQIEMTTIAKITTISRC